MFCFAVLNPGDEVILFDPCFETYETCILMAGGVPVSFGCYSIIFVKMKYDEWMNLESWILTGVCSPGATLLETWRGQTFRCFYCKDKSSGTE